jgi:hypothetical protein
MITINSKDEGEDVKRAGMNRIEGERRNGAM